jgi:hypothetical protein
LPAFPGRSALPAQKITTSRRHFGGEPSGLRDLAVHSAIVGLAGVLVLGALLLAAVAGVVTGG